MPRYRSRRPSATARVRLQETAPAAVTERTFSAAQRKKMAGSGAAMDDGGYPIANASDLANAIKAVGRGSGSHDAIRTHIIARAKALKLTDKLPDNWGADGSMKEADSLYDQIEAVSKAIMAKYAPPMGLVPYDGPMDCPRIKEIFADYAIVEKDEKCYRIDYSTAADGTVTLAEPIEVEEIYQPVTKEARRPASAQSDADLADASAPVEIDEPGVFLSEAPGARGAAWDVLLIKAGLSGNRRFYPSAMLESAVPLFEGIPAYADHPSRSEQRDRPERSVRDVVGWYEGIRWDTTHDAIRGTFKILESADWLRATLKSAWDAGKRDLLGFSINAIGSVASQRRADGSALIESLERIISTDVVTTPGAGGRLLGVLESERDSESESDMNEEQIRALIAEAMAAGMTGLQSQLTETLRVTLAEQASAAATAVADPPAPDPEPEPVPTVDTATATALKEAQDVLKEIKAQNRRAEISTRIDAAKLPAAHTTRLKTRLLEAATRREVDDTEIDTEIQFVRDLIAESGPARPNWNGGTVDVGDSAQDQMRKALLGWFEGAKVDDVAPVRDLKESYIRWSGKSYYDVSHLDFFRAFQGNGNFDSESDHRRVTESLVTTDWASIFADVMYTQMMKSYSAAAVYNDWRKFVSDIEGPNDFRTRHYARRGGYGDLTAVAEMQTYPEMTTPGDEDANYAVSKYGGIESISMETIRNDRLNTVRQMPRDMGYAAARTLYKFVMNMITTDNPTLTYDSTVLYVAAGHANYSASGNPLTVAGIDTVNIAMRDQTAYGTTAEILGSRNRPRYIIIPNELESLCQRILNPSAAFLAHVTNGGTDSTIDPARWSGQGIDYHVYDQMTNSTDWFVVADPTQVSTMVVGFLDGRQDPELFTQDQVNVGSTFSSDKISYKVRHIYGATVLEHRSFYWNNV